ncbi:coiled-coil domain-containing protein mad1 [Steccherinum ochraceum]|uniref:Spindle assembly checkpoint component MAD1 n=1 Tax=Steccherinum ochraceum TaxID=92696 RepID=A0A4R0RU80_9APHY|nr:coiled-coil domain-containing protein mad1 [Steccherinum ochraceum]
MDGDKYSTPLNMASRLSAFSRSTATKRDSLAAELERDPQLSTAKRKQRTQVFTSHMAHASLERQIAALQTSKSELETKLREKDVQIDRLEGDRRWLAEREQEEREEKERERNEREEEKRKADAELRTQRNALRTLREEFADLEDAHSTLSRQTSQTIATQKAELSTLNRQVTRLQEQIIEMQAIADERSHAFDTLQAQYDELLESQDNTTTRQQGEDENWGIVREELHRQASHLRTVEAANAKMTAELTMLRQRNTSVEVLKEQKRELERKLSGMDELNERAVKLEAELQAARREREEWANSSSSAPSKTPVSVTQSLSNLRLNYARLLEEHGSNSALLRRREVELSESEEREQKLNKVVARLQKEVDILKDKVVRAEQRSVLAEREVGFLQAMITSFTAEETAHEDGDTHKLDEATLQKVQYLETLLAEYKDNSLKLEKQIMEMGGDPSSAGTDLRPRQELVKELEEVKAKRGEAEAALKAATETEEKHLAEIDKLEQTLFELQGEIGGGRHLPPGVRVLSLRDNPASQWEDLSKKALDRMKEENEALLKRLKEVEAQAGPGSKAAAEGEELVPRQSFEVVLQEKEELEDAVKQKEKRLLRLKQIYAAKSEEFKEAIASILGLKLAFYPNGQVRVTSQYDLSAAFVFQPSKSGKEGMTMQLVAQGEGGPEEVPQLMRYWVEEEQCIPGFLASITLECYEKAKRSSRV